MDTALSWFRTAQCDFFLYHVHVSTRQCGDAGTEMGLIPSHLHVFVAGAFQLIAWCIVIFFGLSAATLIGKSNQERDRALQQAKDAEQYVDALQVAMREERAEHEKELATMLVEIQTSPGKPAVSSEGASGCHTRTGGSGRALQFGKSLPKR